MADTRKIVIEIVTKGGGDSTSKKENLTNKPTPKEEDPNKMLAGNLQAIFHPMDTWQAEQTDKMQWGLSLARQGFSLAYNTALMEANRSFSLKEDYISQNKMAMFTQSVDLTKNILGSTASGAIAGARVGGVWGAVIGAAIGGGMSLFNAAKTAAQTRETYQLQLNATNKQTTIGERRASLVNGGKGTEY